MTPSRTLWLKTAALFAVLLTACPGDKAPPAPAAARTAVREVLGSRATSGPFTRRLALPAEVRPADRALVAARIDGAIVSVGVELGDRVRRGAVLARFDSSDFRARLAQADAERTLARSERARLEQLREGSLVTAREIEQAQSKLSVAEAAYALASRALRDSTVVAPFDGTVSRRDVSVGTYVRLGSPLFEVVSDELRLAFEVPERFASLVHEGTRVAREEVEGAPLELTVSRISPAFVSERRSLLVLADLPSGAPLLAGAFVSVSVELDTLPNAVRVPKAAVFQTLGRDRLVRVVDGRTEVRDVEWLGDDGENAVVGGISHGDFVVTRGAASLPQGIAVTPEASQSDSE
jgi:membrane fusion protein (multidrug efflux system)